jgi:aspartate dehydrogenase
VLRLGIIGYGAIGRDLVKAITFGRAGDAVCPAVLVRSPRAADAAPEGLTADPEEFFAHDLDAVVECAGHTAVQEHGVRVLEGGADLLITSVGALADEELHQRILDAAQAAGRRVIVPSAGIGALDMLAGAAEGGLERVVITVRKAPEAWKGTPGEEICDLDELSAPATLYEGPVREGARLYPANVNISAAVALASLGLDRTTSRIIADPGIVNHVIEVEAEGAFGRFHFLEDVVPDEDNPKTGKIVAMALIKTVRQLSSTLVVGA